MRALHCIVHYLLEVFAFVQDMWYRGRTGMVQLAMLAQFQNPPVIELGRSTSASRSRLD